MTKLIKKFQNPDGEIIRNLPEVVVTAKRQKPKASTIQLPIQIPTNTFSSFVIPSSDYDVVPSELYQSDVPDYKLESPNSKYYSENIINDPRQLTAASLLGNQPNNRDALLAALINKIDNMNKQQKKKNKYEAH